MRYSTLSPIFFVLVLVAAASPAAAATGTALPWDQGLTMLAENLSGPVARAVAIIGMVAAGVTWYSSEASGGMKKLMVVVFGACISTFAPSLLDTFGITGALI